MKKHYPLFVILLFSVAVLMLWNRSDDPRNDGVALAEDRRAPAAVRGGGEEEPLLPVSLPEPVEEDAARLFDGIGGLEKGAVVRLPLPGGGETDGVLNYVHTHPNGATAAGGRLADGSGIFEIAREPWSYRGFILPKEGRTAIVYSGDPGEGLQVARRPRGEVICEPDPNWKPLAAVEQGPDPEKAAIYNDGRSVGIIYEAIPILHSLPRAEAVIYLDFDGEVIEGHSWEGGARIVAPAHNLPASEVTDMWRRVAEDFAPFEVNVTTDLQAYLRAPQGLRIRCITTTNNFANAGGVAFSNTFRQSGDPVCWNFYRGNAGALVISHEIGHTFGLHHDGQGASGYYGGHGSGATSWGPIMGAPYSQNVTHWSKGDYVNANQQQDDLLFIGSSVPRRFDDHAPDAENATPLTIGAGGAVSNSGVIGSPDDVDAFLFSTGGGSLNLQFNGAGTTGIPNLDIEAKLYNSSGTLITTASPANQLNATLTANLASGTYTVTVDGVGNATWATSGYDDYGSLGEYTITGTVPSPRWNFRVPVNALNNAVLGIVAPGGSGYSITGGNTGSAFSILSDGTLRVANRNALGGTSVFDLIVSYSAGNVPVRVRVAPLRGLKQEIWTGLGGGGLSGLTSNANYPNSPNVRLHAGTFQGVWPADNYGQKFSGYLVPAETGNHVFWTAADDISELWLSTDSNPANRVRVAYNNSNTNVSWTAQASQQSANIPLVAGQRYYVEFLHRENAGGDHAAVAWQTPTLSRRLIATEYLEYPGTLPNRPPWLANMTFRVREDSNVGAAVGTLLAGDFEAGSVLSNFLITGGNTGNAFSLNPSTGVLSVNAALSFATRPKYDLNVRVSDSGGLIKTAQIVVEVEPRAVKREYWSGISGNPISNLTSHANFPNNPTSTSYLPFFETPTNSADNYGQRLSGWLRAPDSGSFTFWIASDDNGELWLSTDETPANKVRIAWHTGSTGSREWGKFATQRSAPVVLEGGKFYYVEALHKEGTGGDNLAVSWSGPDFGQVILGAPHVTQTFYNHGAPVLANRTFTIFDRDSETDAMEAKDWANPGSTVTFSITGGNADGVFTIDPATGVIRAADGGRLPLGTRALTVTATDNGLPTPLSTTATITVNVVRAAMKREVWTGLAGGQGVSVLTESLYFPQSPDETGYVQHFQAPSNVGNNYGQRLSGYLIPPTTGNYTFWIASDDGGELSISTNENPANKRRIAGVTGSVGSQNWTAQPGQQSAVIPLVAGQRYYIEALQKDGAGDDHLAVAWQGPGISRTRIPGNHLEYPDHFRPALKREIWLGNPTLNPPASPPDFTGTLFTFKAPANVGDNYSQRISGYLVPPATGAYTFWLASDDQSELWLSTGEDPADIEKIASIEGWVEEENWDAEPSQKSVEKTLVAGRRYYIEARHREIVGGDHAAVAWEGPGIISRQIIANEHLEHPDAPAERSLVRRELWNGIAGGNVSNLTGNAAFPASPSIVDTLPPGEGLKAQSNIANNYGQRVTGYLVAPDTGRYTFWIASDDQSELWLSTDENPANRIRLAHVSGAVPAESWESQPLNQKSVPVALEAGRRYYLEILHKEGTVDDHLAVAWQGPGFTLRLVPNLFLEHPLAIPGTPSIRREIWTGLGGAQVTSLTNGLAFRNGTPSTRGRLTTFEAPANHANSYGQRISARLIAPESGNYKFWIASDDTSELWLSTDETPAKRIRIARNTAITEPYEWDKFPTQESGYLPLVAGRAYYIEALHKENSANDHLAVAWQGPSFSRQILDGRFLEYPGEPPATAALKREIWTGVGGNNVSNLTNLASYPNSPGQVLTLDEFSVYDNWSDNYGQRISGYLIAPRTGDYQFWIRSDDGGELRLSTTGYPTNPPRIAWTDNATGRDNWTNFPSQTSAVIPLVAGQRCYIEVLHKEGGGDDYVGVAWQGPGFERQIIRGQFLEYPGLMPGQTQSGIPLPPFTGDPGYTFWLDYTGLQGNDRLPNADPNGNGISNSLEFVLGGGPSAPGTNPLSLLPKVAVDGDWAVFEFRRSAVSIASGPFVQMSSLLDGGWVPAVHGAGSVEIQTEQDGFEPGVDRVKVRVPRTEERMFFRLNSNMGP